MATLEFEVKENELDDVSSKSPNGKRNVVVCRPAHIAFVILGFCTITTAVALMVYYIPDRTQLEGTKIPGDGSKPTTSFYTTAPYAQTTDQTTTVINERQTTEPKPTEDPLMVGRLPGTVSPQRYLLNVRPFLYEDDAPYSTLNRSYTFDGWVNIKVECVVPTEEIILHSHTLTVHGTPSVTGLDTADSRQLLDHFTFDRGNMFLVLKLKESLQLHKNYEIQIVYTGLLDSEIRGFYVSKYITSDNRERLTATTQMEGPHARRVLPCFDEPSFKASFDIQIEHRYDMTALSNGLETKTIKLDDHWHRTYFKRVSAMPTYLLAMVVHDFQNINGTTDDGCLVRVWIRPDYISKISTALDFAMRLQTYFNSFLGMKYPLDKLDHIGITIMGGAMENWGLITYEEKLLIDHADDLTITHEISHQWFGNLVTPEWWDDLWLNEGFATYYQHIGIDFLNSGQEEYQKFYLDTMERAFTFDTNYMIIRPLKDPVSSDIDDIDNQIVLFTYVKGGSIVFMMKHFLADGVFEKGIRNYLKERAYKNANIDHLWEELSYADQDVGKHNMKRIMDSWTLQPGAPLVTLNRTGDTVLATQRRLYTGFPPHPGPFSERYYIPLTWVHKSNSSSPTTVLMEPDNEETIVHLEGASADDWYLANFLQTGYYFVDYDEENWLRIVEQAERDPNVFTFQNQLGLIRQVRKLEIAGIVPTDIAYSLIDALRNTSLGTREAALEGDLLRLSLLRGQKSQKAIERRILDDINFLYSEEGWHAATTIDPLSSSWLARKHRLDITSLACFYGNDDCVSKATALFKEIMENPFKNSVKPVFRHLVFCNGIRYGGQVEWEFGMRQMRGATMERERTRWGTALTCSANATALTHYISSLDGSSDDVNVFKVITALADNPIGGDMAWDYIKKNWGSLLSKSTDAHSASDLLLSVTAFFNTADELQELLDFGKGRDFGRLQQAFDLAVMSVNNNIGWVAKLNGD
ncbi:aminopeptidase N-like [Acanthaster planci]|uniref:Aminopeptidase n=1 Tax=Acanthaster planci TaxID=133434 RepID=A0A8B7XUR6_ACAPL|nr:aminopeptidase N-like [Acanthaster planci]